MPPPKLPPHRPSPLTSTYVPSTSPFPKSFIDQGFVSPEQARKKPGSKFRRLMIGTEGRSDTGKTEFALSAPGPGIVVCLDRGFDALYDNPHPPPTRRNDFAYKVVMAPGNQGGANQQEYLQHWNAFKQDYYHALDNVDARTVVLDGDANSWELQRLAAHGKLTGIYPATRYTDVYAARRNLINRAWDAGKIVIATNMVRAEYKTVVDEFGKPVIDKQTNQEVRERTGRYERQGFPDQEYLWQIQLCHLYNIPPHEGQWGIRILKCKPDPSLVGFELWGEDCNFASLVSVTHPNVDPAEWGF